MEENKLETLSVGKLLFRLAVPAITAQIVNVLYNIVDRIFIGHMPGVGDLALTGVGVTFSIIIIISAFSSLIGMGGAPLAAIRMGEKNEEEAEHILGNSFFSLIVIGVVLTLFFLIFNEKLLLFFGASENTLPYGLDYINLYVVGTIFVNISLGLNPFITTQGYAKVSMLTIVIGAVINIILDPIFIYGLNMGVRGASLATIISQAVSAIWVFKFLVSDQSKLKIRFKYMKIKKRIILPILLLGVSPFVMQSTESILNISFNSSLQRYGGDIAVGSMTILASIMQVIFLPIQGLTQGAQPIISYNFGAKKLDRVQSAFKILLIACLTYSTLMWLIMMFIPQVPISAFTQKIELIDYTVYSSRIYMAVVFVLGIQIACQQTFIAIGQAKISLFLALLRKVVLLIPLIYIFPVFFENKVFAVYFAEPISDLIAVTTTVTMFTIYFKKIIRKYQKELVA